MCEHCDVHGKYTPEQWQEEFAIFDECIQKVSKRTNAQFEGRYLFPILESMADRHMTWVNETSMKVMVGEFTTEQGREVLIQAVQEIFWLGWEVRERGLTLLSLEATEEENKIIDKMVQQILGRKNAENN